MNAPTKEAMRGTPIERELAKCSRQLEEANKDALALHETLMQLASEPHAPWSATATAMFESATGAHEARVKGVGLCAAGLLAELDAEIDQQERAATQKET